MTTRLSGDKTQFLPFNRGHLGHAGNPPVEDNHRTAYLWGAVWQRDSGHAPFHLYTTGQAIEERFILDVLKNYITYETYFRIIQSTAEDKNVERKKAARARVMTQHPHNLAVKTEVMVEYFRNHVKHKIGGRAKAMVVTDPRLMAIRYKQSFDQYIKEKGYIDIRTLVAFSRVVEDPDAPGKSLSEVGMNGGIKEHKLPERFDSVEYQVLPVAEKYQTGLDQPLLHTMYFDKKLSGLQAVQTVSRLNRTTTGKEDTFVLDFRNKPEDIFDAFKPYYEDTPAEPLADPQNLYRLHHQIEETRLIFDEELKAFCAVYFEEIFGKLMSDGEFRKMAIDHLRRKVYQSPRK